MKELISQGVPSKQDNNKTNDVPQETQTETVQVEKPTPRRRKGRFGRLPGNLLSESGTGRPTALVREPYHAREADAYRDGDRRAKGDGKQLRGKHSAAPLRAVPRRDKHPVRKPLPKACLTMVIYCILTGLLVYYIALWLWYRYTDSRTSTGRTDDAPLPRNGVSGYTLIGESRYKGGLIGTAQDKSGHLPQAAENDTIFCAAG